ncbi:hypothetical protein FRC07_002959 [Ceratobasidium sp. 392]|nr:hypothetical protein FRC07_002959 [Ceratobasidium sp. 392]
MQSHEDTAEPLPNDLDRNNSGNTEKECLESTDTSNERNKVLDNELQSMNLEVENELSKDEPLATLGQLNPDSNIVDDTSTNIQDCIVHAPDLLEVMSGHDFAGRDARKRACLNKATGMSNRLGVYYQIIPPGYRTSSPHAHSAEDELVFCLQGRGIVWQNGWTYPFAPGDVAGWKAGTGITHTIINDTKRVPGEAADKEEEDLILLVVGENKPGEDRLFYPFNPEKHDIPGRLKWDGPTAQNHWGQHPGIARAERPNDVLPDVQTGARPSNIICWKDQLAEVGEGEMSAFATSLSQETGLSGRLGCNLEVAPPGTRSSDPHAHSVEDELVFVIQGEGSVWLDGQVFPVSPGDAVGFKAGTGLSHTFINDSNASGDEAGQDLVTWIVGENRRAEDKVVYPLHPEKKQTFKRWWDDSPERKLDL